MTQLLELRVAVIGFLFSRAVQAAEFDARFFNADTKDGR
jgi:hypothetical protein